VEVVYIKGVYVEECTDEDWHSRHKTNANTTPRPKRLSVALESLGVGLLPLGTPGTTSTLLGTVARNTHTTGLLAGRSEATHLTVLVSGSADPVDTGVVADAVVGRIHADDFVVLVGGVLVDPVGVENAGVGALAANTAFSDNLEVARGLEVGDTLVLGLTVHDTLVPLLLAAATADGNAGDGVSLLRLVSHLAGLVGAGGLLHLVEVRELAVFPGTNAEQEPHHVGLLSLPDLLEVLVRAHGAVVPCCVNEGIDSRPPIECTGMIVVVPSNNTDILPYRQLWWLLAPANLAS